jgi:replicative DNA helicase
LGEGAEAISNRAGRSAKDLLDFVQSKVMAVSESAANGSEGPQHVGSVLDDVLRQIDDLSGNPNRTDVTGLATGFEELDRMTTGFQAGELIIVAARPAMGKTALSLNIAEHVALKSGKNVAFFSLEMANNQLGVRLLASVARLNQQRVKIGRLNEAEFAKLYKASSDLRETHLFLDEEGSLTANELRARARRLHRECGGLHMVVIDYIGLMEGSGKSDNRAYEMAEISRALKLLAKELHIPVIALAQLNRGLESRPNKRPILSDLRDSGSIEQDADIVLFIYRDEVYNEDSPDKGIAEIIIGKQRNGPTGTVHVTFAGEYTRFDDRHRSAPVPSKLARMEKMRGRTASAGRPYQEASGGVDM